MSNEEELERARSLIALAMNGSTFAQYASAQLIRGVWLLKDLKWDICYNLLLSAAARKDKQSMVRFLSDWTGNDYFPLLRSV